MNIVAWKQRGFCCIPQTSQKVYTALWERGRLDVTVEAVIHDNPKWHPLFTQEDLAICAKRLREYRYLE